MSGYLGYWRVSFNGGSLETYGAIGVVLSTSPEWNFFSPMALVTHGFLCGDGDIWTNLDSSTIQNVTWTLT